MPISSLGWIQYFAILIFQVVLLGLFTKKNGFSQASFIGFSLISISAVVQIRVFGLNGDQASYFKLATEFSDNYEFDSLLESAGLGKVLVPFIAGVTYTFLSHDPILFIQLIVTLPMLIPVIVGKTVREIGYTRFENTSALIASCFPWVILWSPRFGRESFALMILLLQVVVLIQFWHSSAPRLIQLKILILVIITAFVRPQLNVGLCLALGVHHVRHLIEIIRHGVGFSRKIYFESFSFICICLISFLLLKESELLRFLNPFELKAIRDSNGGVEGRSEQMLGKVSDSKIDSIFSVLLGPYPSEWKNPVTTVIGFDGILFAMLLIVLSFSRVYLKELRVVIDITFLLLLPLIVGATIQFANYGLNFRIRAHFYVVMLIAITLALQLLWERMNSTEKT